MSSWLGKKSAEPRLLLGEHATKVVRDDQTKGGSAVFNAGFAIPQSLAIFRKVSRWNRKQVIFLIKVLFTKVSKLVPHVVFSKLV